MPIFYWDITPTLNVIVSHFVSHKPFISADWPSGYLFISVWQCERDIIFAPIFDCVSVLGVGIIALVDVRLIGRLLVEDAVEELIHQIVYLTTVSGCLSQHVQ